MLDLQPIARVARSKHDNSVLCVHLDTPHPDGWTAIKITMSTRKKSKGESRVGTYFMFNETHWEYVDKAHSYGFGY